MFRRYQLALVLALGGLGAPVLAGDAPVASLSFKSLDELLRDVRVVLGTPADQPSSPLDGILQQVAGGRLLTILDTTKPFGLVLRPGGGKEPEVAFLLPVRDARAFQMLLGVPEAAARSADARIYAIQAMGRGLFLRTTGGTVALSTSRKWLEKPPGSSDLVTSTSDVTFELRPDRLTENERAQVLSALQSAASLARDRSGGLADIARGSPQRPLAAVEEIVSAAREEQFVRLLRDGSRVAFGLSFNASNGSFTLDFDVAARSGTTLASELGQLSRYPTLFGSFLLSDAPLSVVCSIPMPAEITQLCEQGLGPNVASVHGEIDRIPVFANVEQRSNAHESLESLLTAFRGLKELNLALNVEGTSLEALSVWGAVKVSSGRSLSDAFTRLGKMPPEAHHPAQFKAQAALHDGVAIHRLQLEPDSPLGNRVLHAAVRGDVLYFSFGSSDLKGIKRSLALGQNTSQKRPPITARIIPSKLAALFAEKDSDVARWTRSLGGPGDVISYELLGEREGSRSRLIVGEAILRAIRANLPGAPGTR